MGLGSEWMLRQRKPIEWLNLPSWKVSGIIGAFIVLREILNNNQVMRSYLVKECELIRNKLLKEIKRPFFFPSFTKIESICLPQTYVSSPVLWD